MKTDRYCMIRTLLLVALLVGCDGSLVNDENPSQNNTTATNNHTDPDAGAGVDAGADGGGTNNMQPGVPRTDPNDLKNEDLFVCDGSPTSSPARIRRLERREFIRGVGGSETGYKASLVPGTNPLNTPTTARYTTYADGVGMDATTLDLYMGVLGDSVTPWTARDARRTPRTYTDGALRCMFEDAAPDESCVQYYLTSLLEDGVLYRPPTPDEMSEMTTFTNTLLAEEASTGATRAATLRRVASAAWMMTGALFRSEMGEDVGDASGRQRLNDWELAQAVAYLISDRAPGAMGIYRFGEGPNGGGWTPEDPMAGYLADIEAAARNGTIQDPMVIQSLIRANISGVDPERFDLNSDADPDRRSRRGEYWMSQKLQHFFREWLGYEGVELKFKDTPYATSQFETGSWDRGSIISSWGNLMSGYYGKEALLAQQLDDMIARIVFEDQDVFKKLMTSRQFFVASSTAYSGSSIDKNTNNVHRAYNITGEVGTAVGDRWVTLPDTERSGVMTHPAFLAAHGGNFEDDANAVHRGRWLREKVLCQTVPGLELVMVEAKLIPSDPAKTA
ncbi:MAG: hypothetical protein R3E66_23610 [bacterium]